MSYGEFMDLLAQDPSWQAIASGDAPNNDRTRPIPYTLVEGRNLP